MQIEICVTLFNLQTTICKLNYHIIVFVMRGVVSINKQIIVDGIPSLFKSLIAYKTTMVISNHSYYFTWQMFKVHYIIQKISE